MLVIESIKNRLAPYYWQIKKHEHSFNVFKICKKCKRHQYDILRDKSQEYV